MSRFCTVPFTRVNIELDGSANLCCWAASTIGNIQIKSIEEVWSGEKANSFRQSILDESYKFCTSVCPWINNRNFKESPFVNSLPVLNTKPSTIASSHDNTCNLHCITCRSSKIIDHNYQRHELIKNRIEEIGEIDQLLLVGSGEIFSSKHLRDWLFSGKISAKSLTIQTNGLLFTRELWNSLPQETKNKIRCVNLSIDASTKETYEKIRRGGNWETLQENIKLMSELRKTHLHYWQISFVVCDDNYKEMPSFVELGIKFGVDTVFFAKMNIIYEKQSLIRSKQIHMKDHPKFSDFQEVLKNKMLDHPIVSIGNIAEFRND